MSERADRSPVARGIRQAAGLVAPAACLGCGARDVALCAACRPTPRPRVLDAGGLAVVAAAPYDGLVRRAILQVKTGARTELVRSLAPLLAAAVAVAVRTADTGERVLLVPLPSTRASTRRRGTTLPVALLSAAGLPATRALAFRLAPRDQIGLGAAERAANVAGAMRATRPRGAAVLVDDVMTTGATIREGRRALSAAGWTVLGAAVACVADRQAHLRIP